MNDKSHKPRLLIKDAEVLTTSLAVAEHFEKRHTHVLDAIERLMAEAPAEFTKPNFRLCHKNNELQNGKPQPYYEITKNGFSLLVMGFTGRKALTWKVRYIETFDAMALAISARQDTNLLAETIQLIKDVVAEEVAKIRAEYATLNATQIAGRMGIPTWSTEGGYLSEGFMLMFFALEHRYTDAVLLWTLYDEFGCDTELRTLSARAIVEASGRALCRNTVYLSRQRLIARGLLLNLNATEWRINREPFEHMMRETQLVADVQRVPAVQPQAHGFNKKLAGWIERVAPKTVQ